MLLFGKDRELIFQDTWIQCRRFVGTDKAGIFDHIEIHEHLPMAVERVMVFLKKHAMRDGFFRTEAQGCLEHSPDHPVGSRGECCCPCWLLPERRTHQGFFFDDRIEIEKPGILLPGLTVEDMLQGVFKLRNRVIARVFRELDLIEQWGSGVSHMFKEAKALGLSELEIIEVGMRVRFIVHLAESIVLPIESY